jgi:hypothetical protein
VAAYTETELRAAVAGATSMSDVLGHFGLRPAGGNHRRLRTWLDAWQISTDHFRVEWPPPRRAPIRWMRSSWSTPHRRPAEHRVCPRCSKAFLVRDRRQRYCSRACGIRWDRRGVTRPGARKAERPPYEQLVAEIAATSWRAVGRKYGVSDNAVRKWVRAYEAERAAGGVAAEPRGGGRSPP